MCLIDFTAPSSQPLKKKLKPRLIGNNTEYRVNIETTGTMRCDQNNKAVKNACQMPQTHFFPTNSSSWPDKAAARPMPPAPSTTHFSVSTNLKMAIDIHSSVTTTWKLQFSHYIHVFIRSEPFRVTILSIKLRAVRNALQPTLGTARPSASVDLPSTVTGFPSSMAFEKLGTRSDSTPCERKIQTK